MMLPLLRTSTALSLPTPLLGVYPNNYHLSAMQLYLRIGKHLSLHKKSYLLKVLKAHTYGGKKKK